MNNNTERTKEFYLMNSYRFELVLYFKNEGYNSLLQISVKCQNDKLRILESF